MKTLQERTNPCLSSSAVLFLILFNTRRPAEVAQQMVEDFRRAAQPVLMTVKTFYGSVGIRKDHSERVSLLKSSRLPFIV